MLDQYIIRDVQQLKALGHAVRVRILHALAEKPMTAKQLADDFGIEPAKTSYHVKQLLKAGLVELLYTRETQNGIVEKYYQSIAREFQTDPGLAGKPSGRQQGSDLGRELSRVQADFLRCHKADAERSPAAPRAVHGYDHLNIPEEQLPSFIAELNELLARYQSHQGEYLFHYLLYPGERE